jgi:RNA polymerase sigma-70 factor (ECF subfamily)
MLKQSVMKSKKTEQQKHGGSNEEEQLVLCLKNGNFQDAFNLFFHLYKDKLLFFIMSMACSKEDAEDIIQDVFEKIWRERDCIDAQDNFIGYIFTIAKNRTIDCGRNKSSKSEVSLKEASLENTFIKVKTPEDILLEQEKHELVEEARNRLPPLQKKIYDLRCNREKSSKDIAVELGISVSAVNNTLIRVKENIRKYLLQKNIFT